MILKKRWIFFFALFLAPSYLFAEEVDMKSYYPSPYGKYETLRVGDSSDTSLSTFTQGLSKSGVLITSDYKSGNYTPGFFWSSYDDNVDKPKAGIWTVNGSRSNNGAVTGVKVPFIWQNGTEGSNLYFGTSSDFTRGINSPPMFLSSRGFLALGIDPLATYEPQSRIWVDNGFVSVIASDPFNNTFGFGWNVACTAGADPALTIIGPHELDTSGNAMTDDSDGYLALGITSDFVSGTTDDTLHPGHQGPKNAGWYFIRCRNKYGQTSIAPQYPVVFKGGAPQGSLVLSHNGDLFIGNSGNVPIQGSMGNKSAISSFVGTENHNISLHDFHLRSVDKWGSLDGQTTNQIAYNHAQKGFAASNPTDPAVPPNTITVVNQVANTGQYVGDSSFYGSYTGPVGTGSPFFTPKKNGLYIVSAAWGSNAIANGKRLDLYLYAGPKTGALSSVARATAYSVGPNGAFAHVSELLRLTTNDKVEMRVWHNNATSVTTQLGAWGAPRFQIEQVSEA